jgi:hypothetical protein
MLRSALLLALSAAAVQGQSATQVVRIQVTAINQIGVTSAPAALVLDRATAGGPLTSVATSGGSWSITTNEQNRKISASLDQDLPAGITLEVALGAPAGASSQESVALRTAAADLVTGINAQSAVGLPVTYRLTASPQVAPVSTTRTVTFTIVTGS